MGHDMKDKAKTDLKNTPGHLIRRLHQLSTRVFLKQVQDAGYELTAVQFATLSAVQSNPKLDQAKIAAIVGYDRATIGGVIERLEKKGLLQRVVSATDRRAKEVVLSDKGKTTLEALAPLVSDLQDDILETLSPKERAAFVALAQKILRKELGQS